MKHLTRTEFVDLVDTGEAPAAVVRHVQECARCRAEADALGATLARAVTDPAPEPSPLFWDHFGARVADAVRNESPGGADLAPSRLRARLVPWAAAVSFALLLIVTGIWRTTVHAPTTLPRVQEASAPATATSAAPDDDVESDEAWAIVRDAARDLEWDDAQAAGISPHPGTLEDVAVQLTPEERLELARLLDEDLKRKGA